MAKLKKVYSFKNAEISTNDEGRFILTEVNKDNTEDFDLTAILTEMIGVGGISLSFGSEDTVPSMDE